MSVSAALTSGKQVHDVSDDWDEDELSDGQINLLLRQAEQRLLNIEPSKEQITTTTAPAQKIPRLRTGSIAQPYISAANGFARADPRRLLNDEDRVLPNHLRRVEDPATVKEKARKERQANAGFDFFHMPATQLSSELQADMRLLKVRGLLDPQRHYKKDSSKNPVPTFSEVGRVIEGPAERYSARLPNRERKRTFVEEILAGERSTGRFGKKYNEIQASKSSGKKAHYKILKSKRSRGSRS